MIHPDENLHDLGDCPLPTRLSVWSIFLLGSITGALLLLLSVGGVVLAIGWRG